MSRFRLPTFIAPCSIWRASNWAGTVPPVNPADVTTDCNLTPGRRVYEEGVHPTSYILIPKGTDIRFSESNVWTEWPPTDPDLVEVPTGSGMYYTVADVERVGLGFANEHLEAAIVKSSSVVTPPPPPVWVLNESFTDYFPGASAACDLVGGPWPPGSFMVVAVVSDANNIVNMVDDGGNGYTLLTSIDNGTNNWLNVYTSLLTGTAGQLIALIGGSSNCTMCALNYTGTFTTPTVESQGSSAGTGVTTNAYGPTTVTADDLQIVVVSCDPSVDEVFTIAHPFDPTLCVNGGASLGTGALMLAPSPNDTHSRGGSVNLSSSADWCLIWASITP